MENLLFLSERRHGAMKARRCANISVQLFCATKKEESSPVVSTKTKLIKGVIEVKQERDTMIVGMRITFAQASVPPRNNKFIEK